MRVIRGRPLHESDYADVRKQLQKIFYDIIFRPVVDILAPHNAQVKAAAKELKRNPRRNSAVCELRNASVAPVVSGIRAGRIQYVDGVFSGDFNAAISSALKSYGAAFNKNTGTFALGPHEMPIEVLAAINEYAGVAKQLHEELDKALAKIQRDLTYTVGDEDYKVKAEGMVEKIKREYNKHFGDHVEESVLSDRAVRELAANYADNLEPSIKKFADEQISELRGIVQGNAEKGYRFDSLLSLIEGRYKVMPSRAELIARTETGNYQAKFHEAEFGDAGITDYIWRTSGNPNVRTDPHGGHKALDGQRFTFKDKAPAMYFSCGEKCNPGEDFNCLPGDSPVDFAYGVRKGLSRWYAGDLTEFVTANGKTVRCTPNHQVLTSAGWKAAGALHLGDYVVNLSRELGEALEVNDDYRVPSIRDIVEAVAGEVPYCGVRRFSDAQAFLAWHKLHSHKHAIAYAPNGDSALFELRREGTARKTSALRGGVEFDFVPRVAGVKKPRAAQHGGELLLRTADALGNDTARQVLSRQLDRVVHLRLVKFAGHVYNLETVNHWYCSNSIILHNCACVADPVLPGVFDEDLTEA